MNRDQKRNLAATLCLIEKDLVQEERLLRSRGEKGVLYEIVDPLSAGQQHKILICIAKLRECLAQVRDQFDLEVDQINLRRIVAGELAMFSVWLQESKTKRLRGYGAVDEGLEQSLDPLLEEMAALIDETLKTLAEA
ncbi:MAG TPA: hypothetical protein VGX03_15215 [Candidatus Binatia bacterium]|nr:hypothetical protein [Candidatus Binatia bacterium]